MADFSASFELDVSQYKASMREVLDSVDKFRDAEGKLNREMLAANGVTVKQATEMEKLVRQYNNVASSSMSAQQKLAKEQQIIRQLSLAYDRLPDSAREAYGGVGNFIRQAINRSDKLASSLHKEKTAVDSSSDSWRKHNTTLSSASQSLSSVSSKLDGGLSQGFSKLRDAALDAVPGIGNIVKALGKYGPVAGAAATAAAGFYSCIKTNETVMDTAKTKIQGFTSVFEEFKRQLGNGQFSWELLISKRELGEEEYRAHDNFGTYQSYLPDFYTDIATKQTEFRTKTTELKKRKAAGENIKTEQEALENEIVDYYNAMVPTLNEGVKYAYDAYRSTLNRMAGTDVSQAKNLSKSDQKFWNAYYYSNFLKNTGLGGTLSKTQFIDKEQSEVAKKRKEIDDELFEIDKRQREKGTMSAEDKARNAELKDMLKIQLAREAALKQLVNGEEDNVALLAEYNKYKAQYRAAAEYKATFMSASKEAVEGAYTPTKDNTPKPGKVDNSLAAIRKRTGEKMAKEILANLEHEKFDLSGPDPMAYSPEILDYLEKNYNPDKDPAGFYGSMVHNFYRNLSTRENIRRLGVDQESPSAISELIDNAKKQLDEATNEFLRKILKQYIADLESKLYTMDPSKSAAKAYHNFSFSQLPAQTYGKYKIQPYQTGTDEPILEWQEFFGSYEDVEAHAKAVKMLTDRLKEQSEVTDSTVSSVNTLADAWGNVISALGGADSEVAKTAGLFVNMMSSIGDAIIQVGKIRIAALASQEGEAMADGVNSTMKLPFPYNLAMAATVIGTVAGIFAQIMSTAKAGHYAYGGYIPGDSFTGDRIPAWVNSGELILNQNEQAVVRSLVGSGTRGGVQRIEVYGKLEGRDILLASKNQERYNSRH